MSHVEFGTKNVFSLEVFEIGSISSRTRKTKEPASTESLIT
jgi:hypothetical protein